MAGPARDLSDAGSRRIRLLRKLAPDWPPYRSLTGVDLRDLLNGQGVWTINTGNVLRLDPADLRRVRRGGESQ